MCSVNPNSYQVVPTGDVWRDRGFLVLRKGAALPDRCVKCNAPAKGYRLKRKLTWPLFTIVILGNITQEARVDVGLCSRHRSRRMLGIAIAFALFLGGFMLFILGASADITHGPPVALTAASIMMIASAFLWFFSERTVWAKKIDPYFAWLKGVSREYLADLPASPVDLQ